MRRPTCPSLAVAGLLATLATRAAAGSRDHSDRRVPPPSVDLTLRQDASVVVNPWNDLGLPACSVSSAGGRLVLNGRTATGSVELKTAPELVVRPATEDRPAFVRPATLVEADAPDGFGLDLAGPFTPDPAGDARAGSIAATGTARFGETVVPVEGTVRVQGDGESMAFSGDLSAAGQSRWLLRIAGGYDPRGP